MNLTHFLERCATTAYAEPRTSGHDDIAQRAVQWVHGSLPAGAKILDVGCGAAFCSELFLTLGHQPTAISLLEKEVNQAKARGVTAFQLEMHELGQLETQFDLIWLRHVAEHSPCPLLLLEECHKSAAPNGLLYLEVPLPWTACLHELNPNHYSVLNVLAWESLLRRAHWTPIAQCAWPILTASGPDCYHSFICRAQKT